ncbi:5,6-dimethylbenzimidazole synthase [Pandoraea vervacti]|uniref:5,6-dimethylbenzimidazole synthase n=1 Tax=Pandoraea vervacti TaxID=656178 RepID=A0ABM5T0J6_9BURK|nr:5,6-dimethylbenzimidazole synthase [Pandoraea vervacti]AJP58421.1 5,6-dimethylbenzimidazole synthase [Pandoraea vervacti]
MAQPFSESERAAVYRAIHERRDMRHFVPTPVDPHVLARLLDAAHHAPSVGFMQPWRIVRITSPALRERLHDAVERERLKTADALGARRDAFMKLKVEGMQQCAEIVVMALMDGRERHIFGRRTMPEMDLASVSCAIQNLWLAARAEGLGMGWVSLFDPDDVARLLQMPDGARPVAILCLGHVAEFYDAPMLAMEGWAERAAVEDYVFENGWPKA